MNEFLLKSTITMATLLGLYYLLFEREKMHRFNRFYLLSALVFSFALPFITVITYIREIKVSGELATISTQPINTIAIEQPINYLFYIGWIVYSVITIILLIRFVKNIAYFIKQASTNTSIKKGQMTLVLLEEKTLPHTFLNYVFVNKEDYELKKIEDELYTHEYTHIKQKHTFDILFIEALKTIFWFNPLLYFYKKAIQLNHEFLADEKVINTTANTIYYQNLLLEKANVGKTFSMASNLNFSLTKKRFIMMTKTTSAVKANFIKAAIAPVLVILITLLCTKTVAQETLNDIPRDKIKALDISKKVTQHQVDSLRKANPKAYKSKSPNDYAQATVKFTDKKGKIVDKKFFVEDEVNKNQKTTKPISNGLSGIPVDKIKSMSVYKNVTSQQVDSLKKATPKTYFSDNPSDYGIIIVEYADENGSLTKEKLFVEQ